MLCLFTDNYELLLILLNDRLAKGAWQANMQHFASEKKRKPGSIYIHKLQSINSREGVAERGEKGEAVYQRDSLILRLWSLTMQTSPRSPFNCELRKINKEIVVCARAEARRQGWGGARQGWITRCACEIH